MSLLNYMNQAAEKKVDVCGKGPQGQEEIWRLHLYQTGFSTGFRMLKKQDWY